MAIHLAVFPQSLMQLFDIVNYFSFISGLVINQSKSELYAIYITSSKHNIICKYIYL